MSSSSSSSSLVSDEVSGFKASVEITELLVKTLENASKSLASRCIIEAASRHGFNAEEEIQLLGLDNLSLICKKMCKKAGGGVKVVENKLKFPIPFIKTQVDINGCQGLSYNRGLFTQCKRKRIPMDKYCDKCYKESKSSASGIPLCGSIEMRMETGLYEFKDPKGRNPTSYAKVLEKMEISREFVIEQTGKLNIVIPDEHFVIVDVPKKKSGRPKKNAAIETSSTSSSTLPEKEVDLFAKLSEIVKNKDIEPETEEIVVEEDKEKQKEPKKGEKESEKQAKKDAKESEKQAKKDAKEAEKQAKKDAKEAEKQAKKDAKEAEKQAKKAKKQDKTDTTPPEPVPAPVAAPVAAPVPAPVPEPVPAPAVQEKIKVKKIVINNKTYLLGPDNVLFDPNTKEQVGIWNKETNQILELEAEDDEEEEEEECETEIDEDEDEDEDN